MIRMVLNSDILVVTGRQDLLLLLVEVLEISEVGFSAVGLLGSGASDFDPNPQQSLESIRCSSYMVYWIDFCCE